MARKTVETTRCAICGGKDVSEPRGDERYCRSCWDKKIAVEEIVAREFTQKRYIGQVLVIDDGYDLFLTVVLFPSFVWDEPAYQLEKDPERRTFGEVLVDVVAADIIEPWGGGKWHLEVFRSTSAEPDDWNGEL